jgi:hypothetical protein
MANLEKHIKSPMQELAEADRSPIPTHMRSPRIIGCHIKIRRHYGQPRAVSGKHPIPIRLNLKSAESDAVKTMRSRVAEINRSLRRLRMPFRLRLL